MEGRDPVTPSDADDIVVATAAAIDGDPPLLPELAGHLGFLMWRAHARVLVALDEALPPGVDIHGYAALLALDGGVTLSQQAVAETSNVSGTTMVRVAAALVSEGLVERVRNPDDRRSYALTRTAAGATAARRWRAHARRVEEQVTAGLSPAERTELTSLLHAAVDADLAPGTPAALRESVPFLISKMHFRMHRDFLAALGPLRIEPRHFGVLTALATLGPIPQATLARTIGVSGAAVVQMIDDLERRGLVQRVRIETDRRTQALHLLPEADAVRAEAGRLAERALSERLGAVDRPRLVELLRKVVSP